MLTHLQVSKRVEEVGRETLLINGEKVQIEKLIEEMAELLVELQHEKDPVKRNGARVNEELADLIICAETVRQARNRSGSVDQWILLKLERQDIRNQGRLLNGH